MLQRFLEWLSTFVARSIKTLLIVEPDESRRLRLADELEANDVQIHAVDSVAAAGRILRARPVDCVVTGLASIELAEELAALDESQTAFRRLPVIACTDQEIDGALARRMAHACTFSQVRSLDRALDLVSFHAHLAIARLSDAKRKALLDLHQSDKTLAGRKVLVVDDDVRNIFALSTILEEHSMHVVSADNGHDAIRIVQEPDAAIDIVLMDIMMPEMDGMETMREIRKIARLKDLPIVAVTAKAMKGDREKCIEAGAWDYLAKPVDGEQMLSVLRAWLHR